MKKVPDKLTELIINWQARGEDYDKAFGLASQAVLDIVMRIPGWNRDRAADFYLFFYPKLSRLIQNFEYKGLSFHAILRNTVSWQVNSFYRHTRTSRKMEYCLRFNSIIEAESVSDSTQAPLPEISEKFRSNLGMKKDGIICNSALNKRIIILTLKNANHISDAYISKIAGITGCSIEWLEACIDELRLISEARRERYEKYCRRINKAYMEICQVHRELGICESSRERLGLLEKLSKLKIRMQTARENLNSVAMTPTNREIADVMQMPKGSIDSGLYHLRRHLRTLTEQDDASD